MKKIVYQIDTLPIKTPIPEFSWYMLCEGVELEYELMINGTSVEQMNPDITLVMNNGTAYIHVNATTNDYAGLHTVDIVATVVGTDLKNEDKYSVEVDLLEADFSVPNRAPVLKNLPEDLNFTAGEAFELSFNPQKDFFDADGDEITVTVDQLAASNWLKWDPDKFMFYVEPGTTGTGNSG